MRQLTVCAGQSRVRVMAPDTRQSGPSSPDTLTKGLQRPLETSTNTSRIGCAPASPQLDGRRENSALPEPMDQAISDTRNFSPNFPGLAIYVGYAGRERHPGGNRNDCIRRRLWSISFSKMHITVLTRQTKFVQAGIG